MKKKTEDYNEKLPSKTTYIEQINKMNQQAMEIERNKPKDSLSMATKAYELAKNISYDEGIAQSLLRMGRSSWLTGDLENGAVYLFDALELVRQIKNGKYEVDILNALGNIYIDFQNYDKSLEYYMEGLRLARMTSYQGMEASILNNIGEIYKELEGYERALEYYLESVRMYEEVGDKKTMGVPLLNIGMVYYSLGDYEKSLKYNELSLSIFNEHKDKIGEGYSLHQLAKVYDKVNNSVLSVEYFARSLRVSRETENCFHEIDILIDLHYISIRNGDVARAIAYLKRALSLSEERKATSISAKICSSLANIYEEEEKYKNALHYYKKFHDTEGLSNNDDTQQKLKNITAQFKMEQAQNEKEIYKLRNVELKEKTKELEKSYENIKVISKIGQSITSTLDLEEVLNTVYESINTLMDAEAFGIGLYHDNTKTIEYKLFIDRGKRCTMPNTTLYNGKSLAAWCIKNRKEVIINDLDKDYYNYLKDQYSFYFGKRPESIIFYPLIVENNVIGTLTAQSYKKNAYSNRDLDMIKAFASYIAIAIRNAQRAEKLSDLSQLDGLTEIPNRRRFDEVIQLEWMRARRYSHPISLLLIDIDYFKSYNDNYGHLSGDKCIKRVAKALVKSTKRAVDFTARYGGDEFIVILPNTDMAGALIIAENMRKNIELLNIEHKFASTSDHVTITVGSATLMAEENMEWNELIKRADEALYMAKEKGRNLVQAV